MCSVLLRANYLRSEFILCCIVRICECFSCESFGGVSSLSLCLLLLLQIHALTELNLFTEAVKEAVQLTQGVGILLPHGHYIAKDTLQV